MISTLVLFLAFSSAADDESKARLGHPELVEVSGIVRSRKYPGIFWTHNDSGNPAALFGVRADGRVVARIPVAAPNLDWEDIAVDADGRLYLGDIGNNGGLLPLRAIHRFEEPDPARPPDAPLRPDRSWYYRFEAGARFDAESLAVDGDRLLLLTKNLDGTEAELRPLSLDAKTGPLTPAVTAQAGRLPGFVEPATGADLSPDGRRLAVCSLRVARVYARQADGSWHLESSSRFQIGQVEAIAWDGAELLVAAEDGRLLRVPSRERASRRRLPNR